MKNMSDYHDHYSIKNVLLLADDFEMFIDICLNCYKLDPSHYFSSSGLSRNAILKMTGVKLEKNSDIDTYLFIKKGLKRGISDVSERFSKTNNKDVKKL